MNPIYKLVVFAFLSIGIILFSYRSLRNPKSHGFFRFFAFEAILGLFLLNIGYWFHNPFSWNQLISWFLLIVCLIPLFFGAYHLLTFGKPDKNLDRDAHLHSFEKTTKLVTTGVYRYIRHPLYGSLLFLAWGIFFKNLSLWGVVLIAISTIALILTARRDEEECMQFFGTEYQEYMKNTKMFIPFFF